jgi:PAS domain S-box-containing protein
MDDANKTKSQLIQELVEMRQRVAQLASSQPGKLTDSIPTSIGTPPKENAPKSPGQTESKVLDSMAELVVYQSLDMRVIWANQAAQESVGQSVEQLVGRRCFEVWHQRDEPCEDCPVVLAQKTGQPQQAESSSPDGRVWNITGYPVRGADGNMIGIVELAENITVRKQAEKSLQEIQHRYQGILERNNDAIILLDLNGIVIESNQRGADMFGYSMDEFVGMSAEALIAPSEIANRRQRRKALMVEEIVPIYERMALHKDGTLFPVEVNSSLGYDVEGKPAYTFSILRDISERKQAEESLRKSEETAREFQEKLTTLLEVNLELSRVESLDELYRRAIELGVERLGFDRLGLFRFDDSETKTMVGTYGINDKGQLTDNHDMRVPINWENPRIMEILRNERRCAFQENHPLYEGSENLVGYGWHAFASLSYGNQLIGWLTADNLLQQKPQRAYEKELLTLYGASIGHLISRLQAEEDLWQSEMQLRNVLENMPMLMDAFDENGVALVWNRECERVTGYSAEAIVGNPNAMEMLYPDPEYLAQIRAAEKALGLDFRNWEIDVVSKSGEIKTVAWSNISGQFPVSGWASWGIGVDVTERKQAENQNLKLALEQERVQILAKFVTQASHEFRTPLSIINTNAHILTRKFPDLQTSEYIERIQGQVGNISKLIEDLTTMSRLDSTAQLIRTTVDLNVLVAQITRSKLRLSQDKNQVIVSELHPDPVQIRGDLDYLTEAIGRIFNNAIRYTPEQGTITVRTWRDGALAFIEITDSGMGIHEHDLPHVFERFYRADTVGTTRGFGLGLPIAKAIIDHHHGDIAAESAPGQGSTFRISLPVEISSASINNQPDA